MNRTIRHTFLAATTACGLWLAPATAQTTATTDPVGAMTVTVPAESDLKIGVPLARPAESYASVSVVDGQKVSLDTTLGDLVSDSHYLIVRSGSAVGDWESIISQNGNVLTLEQPIDGLSADDSIEIRKYWTLSSLFGAPPPSLTNKGVANPKFFILLNDLSGSGTNRSPNRVFAYYSSPSIADGWYDNGTLAVSNDQPLSPESFFTVRNGSNESIEVVFSGEVLMGAISLRVIEKSSGPQDNYLVNPLPMSLKLSESSLVSDGIVSGTSDAIPPYDVILVFPSESSGYNPSPSNVYFYYNGNDAAEGWYNNGTLALSNDVELPAGAAFVVRKIKGSENLLEWTPSASFQN